MKIRRGKTKWLHTRRPMCASDQSLEVHAVRGDGICFGVQVYICATPSHGIHGYRLGFAFGNLFFI